MALDTGRSRSHLAAEAVSTYVERELKIVTTIRRDIADLEAGRICSDDEAMAELGDVIDTATRNSEDVKLSVR